MKWNRFFLVSVLSTALVFSACDKDDDEDENTNAQDQNFVMQASMSNRAEIDMSTLAITKATNASVKTFAQMMIQEHTTAQSELRSVANDASVNASFMDSLDMENKAMQQTLMGLSGIAFDRAYMNNQVTAHQKTLVNFDAEINGGSSQRVKSYATKYRPHIQMHLDSAMAINNRIR